jgi:AraC-like DNA-binding protein
MRTRDLGEAIEAVTQVYCPHTVHVIGADRNIDVRLDVERTTFQPIVQLSYGVPVEIDAGVFVNLFLMMYCHRGAAASDQAGKHVEWRTGQTMPFSAGLETRLSFDRHFVQKGFRLDMAKLESHCQRLLGRPLDQPLRFALQAFSPELEATWQSTLEYLQSKVGGRLALSAAAKRAFDEFLLSLLLHQHPHNFSDELAGPAPVPVPALVRQAERYIVENAEQAMTVSDVAEHLGVSLRSLQQGFRSWRNSTPSLFLRQVRLQRVRDTLLDPDEDTTVTSAALHFGFSHLSRFSAFYHAEFGESPSITLRRGRFMRRR